jgi:amidohydrolase
MTPRLAGAGEGKPRLAELVSEREDHRMARRSAEAASTLAVCLATLALIAASPIAHAEPDYAAVDAGAAAIEDKVIAWRRDIHAHPELGNREFRTAGLIADHLRRLGLDEVRTEVAHTGVVGILRGGLPGPVVALRADMDALPVTEQTGLPFASTLRTTYNGQEVGVMHACGHDTHVAMLLGAAEVLAGMRERIPGTVTFVFQPAEEGPPEGEDGGASLMVAEGALEDPLADAIFGLHIGPRDLGALYYAKGPMLASADVLKIRVIGKQTHGASPHRGIDPIVVASQIIMGLQTIHSRQIDTRETAVISIGSIHGGVRHNIIPDDVELVGTVRTHKAEVRDDVRARIERTATSIAESAGARAEVSWGDGVPVAYNEPALVERMLPTLRRVAGADKVLPTRAVMGYEDFAFYQQQVPGMFVFLGARVPGVSRDEAAPNHSPRFVIDESAMRLGVRTLATLALDFLHDGTAGD